MVTATTRAKGGGINGAQYVAGRRPTGPQYVAHRRPTGPGTPPASDVSGCGPGPMPPLALPLLRGRRGEGFWTALRHGVCAYRVLAGFCV